MSLFPQQKVAFNKICSSKPMEHFLWREYKSMHFHDLDRTRLGLGFHLYMFVRYEVLRIFSFTI